MVRVNGKEVPIYSTDTAESALDRIASKLQTLPEYLYFPAGKPTVKSLLESEDIVVEDLLQEIGTTLRLRDLRAVIGPKMEQQGLTWTTNDGTGVLDIFIAQRTQRFKIEEQLHMLLDQIKESGIAPKMSYSMSNYSKQKMEERLAFLQTRIAEIESRSVQVMEYQQDIDDTEPVRYTDFVLEGIEVNFGIDISAPHETLMETFNYIKLSEDIPIATFDKFYKVLKDFVPDRSLIDYIYDDEIIIQLKTGAAKHPFTPARLTLGESGNIEVNIEVPDIGLLKTDQDSLISKCMSIFALVNPQVVNVKQDFINGSFNFPHRQYNTYIFSELVMNNPLFSSMLTTDDSRKVTKDKTGVHVHFYHVDTGDISAVVTEQLVDDQTPKTFDPKDFPLGSSYIRVRVSKGRNIETVKRFQDIFGRLLSLYYEAEPEIRAVYLEYIPSFGEEKVDSKKMVKLEKIEKAKENKNLSREQYGLNPEIFGTSYSRGCAKFRWPSPVSPEVAKQKREEGWDVLTFPRADSGYPQRDYVCDPELRAHVVTGKGERNKDFEKYRYIGLTKSKSSTKDTFSHLPCCFQDKNEAKKNIKAYFSEGAPAEEVETRKKIRPVYEDKKIAPHGVTGKIIDSINSYFSLIDTEDNGLVRVTRRKGVHLSPSSFLACVLYALNINDFIDYSSESDREELLTEMRRDLATTENAAMCRQEMYSMSVEDIQNILKSPNTYMAPQHFAPLLESLFNCSIFIFSKTGVKHGGMILPNHLQGYYKYEGQARAICIYEHTGSEADNAKYPQCELILRWNPYDASDPGTDVFYPTSQVGRELAKTFEHLRMTYSLDKLIPRTTPFWENESFQIIGQGIDSYGKCRLIRAIVDTTEVTLLTSPIPPLRVMEIPLDSIIKVSIEEAQKVASEIGMPISTQVIEDNLTKELRGRYGNISISIPVEASEMVEAIPPADTTLQYSYSSSSSLQTHILSERIARYISEYMFWLYSSYISRENVVPFSDESIVGFREEYILLDPSFQYQIVSETFNMSSGVMKNAKLVVTSEEVLLRLMYVLRLACQFQQNKLLGYKDRETIEDFYKGLSDFDKYPSQVILEGRESILRWIIDSETESVVYSNVVVYVEKDKEDGDVVSAVLKSDNEVMEWVKNRDRKRERVVDGQPYFFRNTLVSDKVYLAQNVENIFSAMTVARTWEYEGYNPGGLVAGGGITSFNLHLYRSAGDIKLKRYSSQDPHFLINILGYRVAGEPYYTVLMEV